ncbi:hypothetical protein [Streptomyces glaucescens]|nr:hypothetical protein [Streptomyces glaucescens]
MNAEVRTRVRANEPDTAAHRSRSNRLGIPWRHIEGDVLPGGGRLRP